MYLLLNAKALLCCILWCIVLFPPISTITVFVRDHVFMLGEEIAINFLEFSCETVIPSVEVGSLPHHSNLLRDFKVACLPINLS